MNKDVEAPRLTYAMMNRLMDEFAGKSHSKPAGRMERAALVAGALGAVMAILLAHLLDAPYSLYAALTGLTVELLGFGVGMGLWFKREWRSVRHARHDMAEDMDAEFALYEVFANRLRCFPADQRARMHRYVRGRSERMLHRTRLFAGGLDRLGVLPLLLAFYLQFKDWEFGNWSALADVTFTQGMLIFFLLGSYLLVWHLLYLQARVEALEVVLAEAAERDREDATHPA